MQQPGQAGVPSAGAMYPPISCALVPPPARVWVEQPTPRSLHTAEWLQGAQQGAGGAVGQEGPAWQAGQQPYRQGSQPQAVVPSPAHSSDPGAGGALQERQPLLLPPPVYGQGVEQQHSSVPRAECPQPAAVAGDAVRQQGGQEPCGAQRSPTLPQMGAAPGVQQPYGIPAPQQQQQQQQQSYGAPVTPQHQQSQQQVAPATQQQRSPTPQLPSPAAQQPTSTQAPQQQQQQPYGASAPQQQQQIQQLQQQQQPPYGAPAPQQQQQQPYGAPALQQQQQQSSPTPQLLSPAAQQPTSTAPQQQQQNQQPQQPPYGAPAPQQPQQQQPVAPTAQQQSQQPQQQPYGAPAPQQQQQQQSSPTPQLPSPAAQQPTSTQAQQLPYEAPAPQQQQQNQPQQHPQQPYVAPAPHVSAPQQQQQQQQQQQPYVAPAPQQQIQQPQQQQQQPHGAPATQQQQPVVAPAPQQHHIPQQPTPGQAPHNPAAPAPQPAAEHTAPPQVPQQGTQPQPAQSRNPYTPGRTESIEKEPDVEDTTRSPLAHTFTAATRDPRLPGYVGMDSPATQAPQRNREVEERMRKDKWYPNTIPKLVDRIKHILCNEKLPFDGLTLQARRKTLPQDAGLGSITITKEYLMKCPSLRGHHDPTMVSAAYAEVIRSGYVTEHADGTGLWLTRAEPLPLHLQVMAYATEMEASPGRRPAERHDQLMVECADMRDMLASFRRSPGVPQAVGGAGAVGGTRLA